MLIKLSLSHLGPQIHSYCPQPLSHWARGPANENRSRCWLSFPVKFCKIAAIQRQISCVFGKIRNLIKRNNRNLFYLVNCNARIDLMDSFAHAHLDFGDLSALQPNPNANPSGAGSSSSSTPLIPNPTSSLNPSTSPSASSANASSIANSLIRVESVSGSHHDVGPQHPSLLHPSALSAPQDSFNFQSNFIPSSAVSQFSAAFLPQSILGQTASMPQHAVSISGIDKSVLYPQPASGTAAHHLDFGSGSLAGIVAPNNTHLSLLKSTTPLFISTPPSALNFPPHSSCPSDTNSTNSEVKIKRSPSKSLHFVKLFSSFLDKKLRNRF